jgi:hypothetical protein
MKKILYYFLIYFILLSTLIIFFEFAARIYSFIFNNNICAKSINIEKYKSKFDENVGYLPTPGTKKGCNNETYIINDNGFRNYSNFEVNKSKILVIGDSFGFGDEVSDDETISFYLKKNHDINTINAAVYGYGLDQAFIRAEQLTNDLSLDIKKIILIISPHGYYRTNVIERNGIKKPYYITDYNNIKLIKPSKDSFEFASRNRILEKSFLVNFISTRINMTKLILKEKKNDNDPLILGCKISTYYKEKFEKKNISLDVVLYRVANEVFMENTPDFNSTKTFLDCLKSNKVQFIDTYLVLQKNLNKKLYVKIKYGHPTPLANRIVAELISNKINK